MSGDTVVQLLDVIQKQEKAGIMQVEVPMLLLLFRIYDCWRYGAYFRWMTYAEYAIAVTLTMKCLKA